MPPVGGQGLVDFANLAPVLNVRLKETVRDAYCSGSPDGPRSLTAPAWAVRGKGAIAGAGIRLEGEGHASIPRDWLRRQGERLFTLRVEALTRPDAARPGRWLRCRCAGAGQAQRWPTALRDLSFAATALMNNAVQRSSRGPAEAHWAQFAPRLARP